jgi:hypothetical protein
MSVCENMEELNRTGENLKGWNRRGTMHEWKGTGLMGKIRL